MGRYYYGDIRGKFWFAVQDSDDAAYFGTKPTYHCEFHECGCSIYDPTEEKLTKNLFCESCYGSLEEHREKVGEDETWFVREMSFAFTEDDLPMMERKRTLLSRQVGNYMTDYHISGNKESGFTYDYSIPEEANKTITTKQRQEIARLCLGNLIYHCVAETGSCHFFAEI